MPDLDGRAGRRRDTGDGRRPGLRGRDALTLLAVGAWAALILANYGAPSPTPPAVPYAMTAAGHGPGPR